MIYMVHLLPAAGRQPKLHLQELKAKAKEGLTLEKLCSVIKLHGCCAGVLLFPFLGLSPPYNLPGPPLLGAIPLVPSVSTEGITIYFSATRVCIATCALEVLYISLGNRRALHSAGCQTSQSHFE